MILFLDFDGVLHPDAVYLERRRPVLRAEGELFMWAPLLAEVLAEFQDVQIVLSTSWAREFGYSRARKFLPTALRQRTIGATWHSAMKWHTESMYSRYTLTWWDNVSRYEQIKRWVERAACEEWLAIDDKPSGWADADSEKLILTDSARGLSDQDVIMQLVERMQNLNAGRHQR